MDYEIVGQNKNQKHNTKTNNSQQVRKDPAISIIQQFGKKYTNLPEEKQIKAKEEIIS